MILALAIAAAPITFASLAGQIGHLDGLAQRDVVPFVAAQASSYDRNAKSATENWFANGDAGQFLRVNQAGGPSYVLADLKGPGAVTRIWSANPSGRLDFFFDGEAKPRWSVAMADYLNGKALPPALADLAYVAARGWNSYLPLPYAKSLRIEAAGDDALRGLYYHVGYRTYPAKTAVTSFQPAQLSAAKLTAPSASGNLTEIEMRNASPSGRVIQGSLEGAGIVRRLEVQLPLGSLKDVGRFLRTTWIDVSVDGERSISAPLGDFFGTTTGVRPYVTRAMTVDASGRLVCELPMPVRRNFVVRLSALDEPSQWPKVAATFQRQRVDAANILYLRARFQHSILPTRPMRDLSFLDAQGTGKFVGVYLHVANPDAAWWGEGDEKIYVDGEHFPSTFGTGTEDYFGYAWCDPTAFQRPNHMQISPEGPGNWGNTSLLRWHLSDPIPFKRSLKFDMELWHWADLKAIGYDRVAYWYSAPGNPIQDVMPSLGRLMPLPLEKPAAPKGAYEGEDLEVLSRTGGNLEVQTGFWEMSKGKQLWWTQPPVGAKLRIAVPVPVAGRYRISGSFCHAPDYGIHRLSLDGKELASPDFYASVVALRRIDLGVLDLAAGAHTFQVECLGARQEAKPGRMFGVDYLYIEPIQATDR